MSNWWESAPLVEAPSNADEWWKAAPMAGDKKPATETPAYSPGLTGAREIAEDVMTRIANSATFGLAAKAKAGIASALGEGEYDEKLKKYRAENEAAGRRLGWGGELASDVVGGLGLASALGNAGITLAGRLSPSAGALAKIGAGAVEGAAYGAAYGAGNTDTGNVGDYATNAALGAAVGAPVGAIVPAITSAAGRAMTPFRSEPSAERARLVKVLQNEGVPVSAGQRTGNVRLQYAEDATAKLPFGTALARNPTEGQMEAVTQAAARRAGINASEITDEVLDSGFKKVGGTIGRIQSKYPINVDDQLLNDAIGIDAGVPLLLEGRQKTARMFLDKITSGQVLDPDLAQTTRTQLNRAIRAQKGPQADTEYKAVLLEIKDALDGALDRTIMKSGYGPDINLMREARQQYANLHVLTDALYRSGASGQLGTLTPTALQAAQAASIGKTGYMQGRGDLTDLAKASSALLRKPPDSGTATRSGLFDPIRLLMSPAAQLAVNSRMGQAYMGNQVAPQGIPVGATAIGGLLSPVDDLRRRAGLLSP